MALRDWRDWQIGMLWGLGIGALWLLGRVVDVMTTPTASGARRGGGASLLITALTILVVFALAAITIRWARSKFLE